MLNRYEVWPLFYTFLLPWKNSAVGTGSKASRKTSFVVEDGPQC